MDGAVALAAEAGTLHPNIRLYGDVNGAMLAAFMDGLAAVEAGEGPLVLELTTTGGDAEFARRMAADVRLFRERTGRRTIFFGKAVVYSSGTTVMSAFPPQDRWLAAGTRLMIHERSLQKTITLDGPLAGQGQRLRMLLAEVETGLALQEEGFGALVEGAAVSLDEVRERARDAWYLDAEEALRLGLVGAVV